MEYLPHGFTLEIPPQAFPLSTDSMALAHFSRISKNAKILDLGSGCATLGLLLCAKNDLCHVIGLERDETSHIAALHNIRQNQLDARLESIHGDIADVPTMFQHGIFSVCISNPPYFSGGPASATHAAARRDDFCPVDTLIRSAAWALKYGGDFFLVHRPERLGELIASGARAGLEAKRLALLRHKAGDPVSLVLLQMRKGGKPGLIWEDWVLHHADATPTQLYREIYHIEEV